MADADDFDVEALRALLRGEGVKPTPAPGPSGKATSKRGPAKKLVGAKQKQSPRRRAKA